LVHLISGIAPDRVGHGDQVLMPHVNAPLLHLIASHHVER
jgi:hypothetical protein